MLTVTREIAKIVEIESWVDEEKLVNLMRDANPFGFCVKGFEIVAFYRKDQSHLVHPNMTRVAVGDICGENGTWYCYVYSIAQKDVVRLDKSEYNIAKKST